MCLRVTPLRKATSYAQGYETTGKLIYDAWHTARVIDKNCQMPRNKAGVILHCMAWGTGKKFTQGGEHEGERLLAANHGVVKHDKGKCYIIHPDNCVICGLLPQSPGQLSTPQLWHHFHDYLQHTPVSVDLHAVNDDLVGFFNSVPQDRLIQAGQPLATYIFYPNHDG